MSATTTRLLIAEARGKYKSLDGVVVVSPKLLARLADALEAATGPGWLAANVDMDASTTIDPSRTEPEGDW